MKARLFDVHALPIWAAILPLVTIILTHAIAASAEHVPACIAFISGCTSVSSTGRMAPESLVFRAGMVPAGVILILFWHRCASFLALAGESGKITAPLKIVGFVLGLSLMLYALTLGFAEGTYPFWRRVGMSGFAIGTFVAELLFLVAYRHLRRRDTDALWRWLVVLCIALPMLDVMSEIIKWAGVEGNSPDHVATWNAFVVASAYYLVVGQIWRRHGLRSDYRLERRN